MKHILRIHGQLAPFSPLLRQDVHLTDTSIEEFDFKENQILCVDVVTIEEKIPLRAVFVGKEIHLHPTRKEKNLVIFNFMFHEAQNEQGFGHTDFADALQKIMEKRTAQNEMLF